MLTRLSIYLVCLLVLIASIAWCIFLVWAASLIPYVGIVFAVLLGTCEVCAFLAMVVLVAEALREL